MCVLVNVNSFDANVHRCFVVLVLVFSRCERPCVVFRAF